MRSPILTKTALLAAGLFSAAALSSFAETYTSGKGLIFDNYAGGVIEVNTSSGQFPLPGKGPEGTGTLVKTGANTLSLEMDVIFYSLPRYTAGPYSYQNAPNVKVHREDGTSYSEEDAPTSGSWLDGLSWEGGELRIEEGTLQMRGAVNLWADYGSRVNAGLGMPTEGEMRGVGTITLMGTATLDIGRSVLDPVYSVNRMFSGSDNHFVFLNNLRAGTDNSQAGTILDVGFNNFQSGNTISDRYHVDLHVDGNTLADGGSIGVIVGDANVYKTGSGKFTLLGESIEYSGNFYAAGGVLVLGAEANSNYSVDSASNALKKYYGADGVPEFGRTLWSAKSLTLAGTVDSQNESKTSSLSEASRNGALVRSYYLNSSREMSGDTQTSQTDYYKEAYFVEPSAGTLVVNNNQVVRNFQAMFANGASATDSNRSAASAVQNAADSVDTDAPVIAGTGAGSYLAVAEGATLAVYQEAGKGGIYKGTICGVNETGDAAGVDSRTGALTKGGTIVKYGEGDIALVLEGANYEKLAILEAKNAFVNINAINLDPGSYDWTAEAWVRDPSLYVAEGVKFTIVENEAATLKMRLDATDLTFSSYAYIDTVGGQVDVSNDRTPGYVEVASEQRFVDGIVSVENGMTLILTATDFAGEVSGDVYKYYDRNGSGTFTDADGDVYAITRVEKNLETGKRVYYYTDADDNEQSVEEGAEGLAYADSIVFSGGSFGNAAAIVLSGKLDDAAAGKSVYSTLAFNGTDQKIRNLTGDGYSKVELGTSTLTVDVDATEIVRGEGETVTKTAVSTFDGAISGVGNLVKTGAETLTLGGGASLSYMGATVISDGSIKATKARSLWDSSALVLNGATRVVETEGADGNTVVSTEDVVRTTAVFTGAQNLVALFGASNSEVTLSGGELRLGADASRQDKIDAALAVNGSALGVIVTDDLGNSDEDAPTFPAGAGAASTDALVAAYLKPLTNLADAEQAEALKTYFSGARNNAAEVRGLFGLGDSAEKLSKADVTRIYLKLLRANGLLADNAATEAMIERLAFDGAVTAKSISKVGGDRATLSGTVEAESLAIYAGAVEIDADALASDDTFSKGVTIAAGATFAINTTGVEAGVFDKVVSGDGNFEKIGDGALTLGEDVVYYGTTTVKGGDLTMTLRSTAGGTYSQGDVFVESADSTLTFFQETDTLWTGMLGNKGDLVKTGAGTLELRGAGSRIDGGVAVKEGALLLADFTFADGAPEGALVSVEAGTTLTFEQTADSAIDRAFSGAGTLAKAGTGMLTLQDLSSTGDGFGAFAGDFRVQAGTLVLASGNIFSDAVSVDVAEGATLSVNEDQTFKALSGTGDLFLEASTLTLTLANGDALGYDKSAGVYRATVNGVRGTDYSSFTAYSGRVGTLSPGDSEFLVGGEGSLVFSGEVLAENIELSVKEGAALITSVLTQEIRDVSESGSVVLAYSGADDAFFTGEIFGAVGRTVGKIGTGTIIMDDARALSWQGAKLRVYEGTLALRGASAFGFASAVVVEGATLSLEYTRDSAINLSSVEGSGTIRLVPSESMASAGELTITNSSMLSPDSGADRYFNGVLDAGTLKIVVNGAGVSLCSVQTTGGFFSEDKVTLNQAHDTTIGGDFSGNVEVTGAGVLTIEDVDATGTILVNDGGVRIDASAERLNNDLAGGLRVKNDAKIYFANTNSQDVTGRLSGVQLRGAVKADGSFENIGTVELIKTGAADKTLDFLSVEDGGRYMLSVEQELWNALTGDDRGNAKLSVGVSEGTLAVSGLDDLNGAVGLVSYGAGTLEIRAVNAHQTLDRSISGDGNVAFGGGKTTTVSVDQSYTGETTISSGASVKFDNVALATSKLTVNGTMTGGVRLVGTPVVSVETRAVSANAAATVSGGDFVNNGTVTLDVSAGDRIEYAGTFDNRAGTIRLTGAAATKRGNEIVLFKSLSGTKMSSQELTANFADGRLTNGSSALMLAQTSDGVLSAFSLGESFGLTDGLHDGLSGSFTAVLDRLGGLDDAGEHGIVIEDDLLRNADDTVNIGGVIGSALNRDSAARLADDVANLSPIGFASMIALPRSSFANDVRAISERASHRRFDSTNEIYNNGAEFFARAQSTLRDGSKEADGANFDFNSYGVLVGADVKPDDYSLYGVAVGYDYGSATLHGGGGKIRSDGLRATAFFSSLLGDGTFFADMGAQVGVNRFETDRSTLVGKADGDADGWNVGAFANFGKGIELSKGKRSRLLATPYVGLEYLYSRVGSFDENGVAGLDVDSFDANSLVGRLGVVFDWQFQLGDWEARLSLGAAYAHEFLDDEADVDASFRRVADSKFRATGTIGAADTFSLAPSLTVDLSERNSLQFGYVLEYGTDEQLSHNFNAGFRHTF